MRVKSLLLVAAGAVVAAGGVYLFLEVRGATGAQAPAARPLPPGLAGAGGGASTSAKGPLVVDRAGAQAMARKNPLGPAPGEEGGPARIVHMPPVPPKPASAIPTVTTPSGLELQDEKVGSGPAVKPGDIVTVHYTAWIDDHGQKGLQIDNTHEQGQPRAFRLGAGNVIAGLDEGLTTMRVGGKRTLVVPAHLAYGQRGAGQSIPPGTIIRYEVEVVATRDPSTPPPP